MECATEDPHGEEPAKRASRTMQAEHAPHLRSACTEGNYFQLTSGGIELRIVSVLPPVCRPNIVPLS